MGVEVMELLASSEISSMLTRLGRTEDVRFSPNGRRLAIAGFGQQAIYVMDVEIGTAADGRRNVTITGLMEACSKGLAQPHGVCFLDDDTIAVANRGGVIAVFALPPVVGGVRRMEIEPSLTLTTGAGGPVNAPGSVLASTIAPDLFELLVCDNAAHAVTRHVLDARDDWRVLCTEVVARQGLEIPDGLALSPDGRWLAVSSHDTHNVLIYRYDAALGPSSLPTGVLDNINSPHALFFSSSGDHVVVADAGLPYLKVFARGDDDWRGTRQPVVVLRIMDDDAYIVGHYNPQEGGPKGLAVDPSMRLIAVTSEFQPLEFFDADGLIPDWPSGPSDSDERPLVTETTRVALVRALRSAAGAEDAMSSLELVAQERAHRLAELDRDFAALRAVDRRTERRDRGSDPAHRATRGGLRR